MPALMPLREIDGRKPSAAEGTYVDESALLIGAVVLHRGVSVWPCALMRADDDSVEVGEGSAVMDMAFVEAPRGRPVKIGKGCLVSHCARLHGCVVEDGAMIGVGATVLDGAKVGRGSIVAAGSLVPPGKEVPPGSVVAGVPATVLRQAGSTDADMVAKELATVGDKARRYAGGTVLR